MSHQIGTTRSNTPFRGSPKSSAPQKSPPGSVYNSKKLLSDDPSSKKDPKKTANEVKLTNLVTDFAKITPRLESLEYQKSTVTNTINQIKADIKTKQDSLESNMTTIGLTLAKVDKNQDNHTRAMTDVSTTMAAINEKLLQMSTDNKHQMNLLKYSIRNNTTKITDVHTELAQNIQCTKPG